MTMKNIAKIVAFAAVASMSTFAFADDVKPHDQAADKEKADKAPDQAKDQADMSKDKAHKAKDEAKAAKGSTDKAKDKAKDTKDAAKDAEKTPPETPNK